MSGFPRLRNIGERRNKFGARRTEVDGISFDSAAEARRYSELVLLNKAGLIRCLELQPEYRCIVNGQIVCTYVADFRYFEGDRLVVEDVKSEPTKTALYKLKRRLVEACFPGVTITEVTA